MAVEIVGPHETRHKFKKLFRNGPDAGVRIMAGAAAAALCIGGAFLYLGVQEYSAMTGMRSEWTEISGIASGGTPAAGFPENMGFIEIPVGDPDPDSPEFEAFSGQAEYKPDDLLYKAIDLKAVQAVNPNVSGYIYIPGIPVDYPILKELEPEQYFYIDHNIYNRRDKYGSIFELCDEERGGNSPVTWIFGHHMGSGSMFSGLYQYLEPEFAGTMCYVYREDYRSEYRPFAACLVDMHDDAYAFGAYAPGSEAYANLLEHLKEKDRYPVENVQWPDAGQDILVLSTCYGNAGTRNRLIVLFQEVRRAAVPEYYDSLKDAQEYGGDQSGVSAGDIPGHNTGVDGSGALTDMPGLAGTGFGGGNYPYLEPDTMSGTGDPAPGAEHQEQPDPGGDQAGSGTPAQTGDAGTVLTDDQGLSSMAGLLGGG